MTSGNDGQTGPTGATGNGIASITKTGTSGLVDTYTITYTNGNTTTFTVTNGEDANITRTEFEELKQENEDLKNNQLTGQSSGQSIYLSDSADSRVRSIGLSGNSEQESTTGKNLFDIETSTASQLCTKSDNVFTTSAMSSYAVPKIKLGVPLSIANGTDYYISYDVKINSGDIKNLNYYGRLALDENLSTTTNFGELVGTFSMSNLYQRVVWKTTATSDFTANYLFLQATSGITNAQTISIKNIQISLTNVAYEPYTGGQASPNPSYPQEIHSTGDNVNLFDKDNAIDGKEINNAITGQIGNGPNWFITDYIGVVPNNTYVVSGKANGAAICYYNANKEFVSGSATGGNSGFTVPNDNNIKYVILNGLINQKDTFKLEKGTVASPYTSYGMGSVNEKVQNKNLWNVTTTPKRYVSKTTGVIGTSDDWSASDFILIKGNTDYVYSGVTNSYSTVAGTAFYDKNKEFISAISSNVYSFKTPVNAQYVRISLNTENPENIQLEQGTATDYVPHEEQNITIPCQQPMRSIGEYKDTFVKVDGNWYERHYIGEVVLDGSRVWNKSATYSNETYFCGYLNTAVTNIIDGSLTLNNSFQIGMYSYILDKECMSNNVQLHVRILASRLTENSANGFKQWLSTHNVKAYGRYVTPLDLPCTEEQVQALETLEKARTYNPVTHISSTDEVPATVDITYVRDLETVINNLSN